jgi:hypothetical protein
MTPAEALDQIATEFEQRRARLSSEVASSRIARRWMRDPSAQYAAAAYESELQSKIDELTWAIGHLRERARSLRGEEAA